MPGAIDIPRPTEIPFESLRFTITPGLVSMLTWVHECAGVVRGMRFSHYGRKRLETRARIRRILRMVVRTGYSVSEDEVTHVLAGDLLPPHRRAIQDLLRRAVVLCEAVDQLARRGEPTTPATFTAYLDLTKQPAPHWASYTGHRRIDVIQAMCVTRAAPEPVSRFYAWLGSDPLLSTSPVLRAVALHWALSLTFRTRFEQAAVDATVAHELRAGGLDANGLLVPADHQQTSEALRLSGHYVSSADHRGDLTDYFIHVGHGLAQALVELRQRLDAFQDGEDRLPWLTTRLPDDLDRRIFDVVERFGTVTSQQILGQLSDAPPLRTLQRRLQVLTSDGLITRLGGRKNATYRLAERA